MTLRSSTLQVKMHHKPQPCLGTSNSTIKFQTHIDITEIFADIYICTYIYIYIQLGSYNSAALLNGLIAARLLMHSAIKK